MTISEYYDQFPLNDQAITITFVDQVNEMDYDQVAAYFNNKAIDKQDKDKAYQEEMRRS